MLPSSSDFKNRTNVPMKYTRSSKSELCVKRFSRLVSLALGITIATNSYANSHQNTPEISVDEQEISTMKNSSSGIILRMDTTHIIVPPKPAILPDQEDAQVEPVSAGAKLRIATAKKGDSVSGFMLHNFGAISGWEGRLVNKATGDMVIVAETDLIAGETYVWARNKGEATVLANIFKKQTLKKVEKSEMAKTENPSQSEISEKTPTAENTNTGSFTDPAIEEAKKLGIDLQQYLYSISSVESGHRYDIDNSRKGEKLGIDSSKWAYGKYQFTNETLQSYGIDTEKARLAFLKSPKKQESLMKRYTLDHIKYIMQEPVFGMLIESGVEPNHILSAMHHRGRV